MSDAASRVRAASAARTTRFRAGALVALAVVVGLILWLALRDTGGSSTSAPAPAASASARAVTAAEIRGLAAAAGHAVFWLGPRAGTTYELTQSPNGSIYIRYLPRGVKVGAPEGYLTVATYPFPGAYGALAAVAKQSGSTSLRVRRSGLAVVSSGYPASVHLAYPGVDYQIEVYDPTPGVATALVASGKVAAIGSLRPPAPPEPRALSRARLRSLASSVGHPVYWAGPKPGYTYEATERADGAVYVRYLPPGIRVGTSQPYLTVASYRFPNAFQAVQRLAQQQGKGDTIELPGGGIAVVGSGQATSIHLAYPGSDVQVEVFDPSPAAARQLVTSGKIKTVG